MHLIDMIDMYKEKINATHLLNAKKQLQVIM